MKKTKYRIVEVPTKTTPYYIVEQLKSFLGIKYWEEIEPENGREYNATTFNSPEEAELFIRKLAERKQRQVVKILDL